MSLGGAIGDLLPAAVGVAVSPIPVIATVLMLMSARARQTAPAFAAGWVAGLALVGAVVLLLASPADVAGGGSGADGAGWLKVALGLLFFALAARQWRRRPRAGEAPRLPGWMAAIDRMPARRAFALAAALAAVNPKNLSLTIAGALSIAQAGLSTGRSIAALAVYLLVAACTVVGPAIAYTLARDRVEAPLLRAKDWLVREQTTVMTVLLLVLGAVVLGDGVRALSG